ncbi:hypothetical protein [Janthinobacterium sp. 75]|uniref:hypothetical protein n=1 Tax=Janthinobacterium sp. 75 TaxID=2135628 RepID=UPI001416FFCD|nr:hypothetical protein [Janthinobacterium sp. 75]
MKARLAVLNTRPTLPGNGLRRWRDEDVFHQLPPLARQKKQHMPSLPKIHGKPTK